MQRWTSEPLPVPRHEVPFASASLQFEQLRHDGPSFSVHLYFDNPGVEDEAGEGGKGFAGSFVVFGHGDCWGDVGHCEVPEGPIAPYDDRPPHPLSPISLAVECTEALRALGDVEQTTVTALAHSLDPEKKEEALRFGRLTLVTYD
jgi:hypothetical protein